MRPALIVLALCGGSVSAHAGVVASYAYITKAETRFGHVAADTAQTATSCKLTARLPQGILPHRPSSASSELFQGATTFVEEVDDYTMRCHDLLHTWQRVTFVYGDRGDASFVLPRAHRSLVDEAIWLGFMVLLLAGTVDRARALWRRARGDRGRRRHA